MIKYIVTDLDGTLFFPYDKKHLVEKGNVLFLRNFVKEGGKVILCSGRSVEYSKKVVDRLGFDCDVIGFNGAVTLINNQIKERVVISHDVLDTILNIKIDDEMPSTVLFGKEGLFATFQRRIMNFGFVNLIYRLVKGGYSEKLIFGRKNFLNEIENGVIYKVLFAIGITKKAINQAEQISKDLRNKFKELEIHWSNECIEVSPKGCTKGDALKEYFESCKIDKSEVLVVGDSGNDIPMFKEFYENSFCISRSPKGIKKYAKYEIEKIEYLSRYLNKK